MIAHTTRWSVIWWSPTKHKLLETTFDDDLPGALALYEKAKAAGAKLCTLRSMNTGWSPPPEFRPQEKKFKVKVNGRKRVETKTVYPMHELNLKGIWWCPYCMKMRKFRKQDQVTLPDGSVMDLSGYYCPLCGISHRDHHVRKHNPVAIGMPSTLQTRRPRGPSSRRAKRNR